MASKVKVAIIESEAGWGTRVDEVREFDDMEKAQKFIREYNAHNVANTAPSWYMYARLLSDY